MERRTVVLIVVLFALIVGGMFGFAYLKQQELAVGQPTIDNPTIHPHELDYVKEITATKRIDNGLHIIAGEVLLPSPCHTLTVDQVVAESFPEQVTLQFQITTTEPACALVRTPAAFEEVVAVSREATYAATLNGRVVPLDLKPLTAPTEPVE